MLKWPILTEMTVKYGKYFNFSCQQGGEGGNPPCGAEWGGGVPTPGENPVISTHLKLCLATATHNFKWVKITYICLICNDAFANHDVSLTITVI